MNSIDKNPNYKEIYSIITKMFESTKHFFHGPFDETYFALRVYETSKEIISKLDQNVKVQVILVASLLHDIGKTKIDESKIFLSSGTNTSMDGEWGKHPKFGVPIVRAVLTKLRHSEDFIEQVCFLVKHHDTRGDKIKNKSIELQILQDADLLADCGFAGFIRPFLYGSKFSRQTISSIKYLQTSINRVEEDGMLNLEVSKNIAKRKIELEKRLICEISKDIESNIV